MGHVPSKEASSVPFLVDLQGAKGGIDRMMAVALTKDNFPSVNHPLFQQFYKLRCDPSVLHWFNVADPKNRTEIPEAPTAEYLYQKHVVEVTEQQLKSTSPANGGAGALPTINENGEVCPIPICLFRIVPNSNSSTSATSGGGGVGGMNNNSNSNQHHFPQYPPPPSGPYPPPHHQQQQNFMSGMMAPPHMHNQQQRQQQQHKTLHEIIATEEVEIVGYVGMRCPTNPAGPVLSVFLDKSLWNEAKSISIFQIAAKCYEHFSRNLPGGHAAAKPRWPTKLQCRALDTNLPTLRLIQKITREYQRPELPQLTVDHSDQRVSVSATPATLLSFFSGLASSVYAETWPGTQYHRRFCVLTQRSTPNDVPPVTPFDAIVDEAKKNWAESNALVVAAKKEAEQKLVATNSITSTTTTPPNGTATATAGGGGKDTPPGSTSSTGGLTRSPEQRSLPNLGGGSGSGNDASSSKNNSREDLTTLSGGAGAGAGSGPVVATGSKRSSRKATRSQLYQQQQQYQKMIFPFANQQHQSNIGMMIGGSGTTGPQNWASAPPPQHMQQGNNSSNHHGNSSVANGAFSNNNTNIVKPSSSFFAPHPPSEILASKQHQQHQKNLPQQLILVKPLPPVVVTIPTIKLPFQTSANILLPTTTPGVLQPFPIKWCQTDLALKPSSQCSQHPGMLLELAAESRPTQPGGTIDVIGVNGVMPFVVPDPCYINLAPGTQVFVSSGHISGSGLMMSADQE